MQSPPYPSDRASAPSTLRRIRRGRICRPLCNHTISSHSDQMGQGASTPQHNDRDIGASSQGENVGEDSRDSGRVHPTVRRSRRLRNSITRLSGRLMRSGSSVSPSHGSGTSAISPRGPISRARLRAGLRSSPPVQSTGVLSPRSTSNPPVILPPILSPELPSEIEPDGDLTMSDDIDGVTPPYTPEIGSSPSEPQSPNDTPSVYRRSRLGGRSSISTTLPHLLAELGSPRSTGSSSRRNSQFRPGLYDSFGSHDFEDDMDLEMPSRSNTPSESITRRPHPDFTPFGDPNTMDLLENPRVRPGEDQAAMLSRLLSVAAAMTAASLVGSSEQALTEAQDVAGDSVDGSFESFLRALQNGRLAAALRNGGNEMGGGVPSEPSLDGNLAPLNFFRMFRFGTTNTTNQQAPTESASATPPPRMVPVIIVGIRSVTPRESTNQTEPVPQPFMDTLSTLSTRRSRMRHGSRRASMGTVGENSGLSGRAARPASEVLFPTIPPIPDTPQGPHPPPSTPADLGVSPLTPSTTSSLSNNSAESSTGSRNAEFSSGPRTQRRQSAPHSIPSIPHEGNSEPSTASGDSTTQATGQAGQRRQGGEGTRSWIIYVLGGSYPENHPILTTPSLFTDVSPILSRDIPS